MQCLQTTTFHLKHTHTDYANTNRSARSNIRMVRIAQRCSSRFVDGKLLKLKKVCGGTDRWIEEEE